MSCERSHARPKAGLLLLCLWVLACSDTPATMAPALTQAGASASGVPSSGGVGAPAAAAPASGRGGVGAVATTAGGMGGSALAAGRAAADGGKAGTAAGALSGGAGGAGAAGTVGTPAGQSAATSGAGGSAGSTAAAGSVASGPRLPSVTSTAQSGPFDAMQAFDSGPKGASGLFRPRELGQAGVKHPVFIWGCGGSSTPRQYADQLQRVASHGFIVIADVCTIGDNGAPLKAAVDWIIAENARADSPMYGVVATDKIAMGGHSIGSANTFFVADDPRLTTTIHVAGGSLDDVNDPFAETSGMGGARLTHPVAYICSMSDTFRNVEKSEKDYDKTRVPAFMTVMTGVEHVGAAASGLPATIAWLRWHLAGETERRSAFLDAGGEFTSGIFVSKNKNW